MLSRSQVNRRIDRAVAAHKDERLRGPQIIQRGRAVRYRGVNDRLGYVAEDDAPDSASIKVWLDQNVTDDPYSELIDYVADDYAVHDYVRYLCLDDNGPGSTVYEPGVTAGWESYWQAVKSAITLPCRIVNGTSLMYATPHLSAGAPVIVKMIGGAYLSGDLFNGGGFNSA